MVIIYIKKYRKKQFKVQTKTGKVYFKITKILILKEKHNFTPTTQSKINVLSLYWSTDH